MANVTVEDLRGLLSAIDSMENQRQIGSENETFNKECDGAQNCYDWVLAEIRRREKRIMVRKALKSARRILSENKP